MKLIEINSCNFGSTGNIMLGISEIARKRGIDTYICVPKSRDNSKKSVDGQIFVGNRILRNLHILLGEITGYQGCFSVFSTWNFLRKVSKIQPDIIHLHNLHGNYINLPMLFHYVKKHNIPVVWTLHDCWSFTGQCPHFTMAECERWKTGCHNCTQYKKYPASKVDRTKQLWRLKKKWFTGVPKMTIVTPSGWLGSLARESYLLEYPVEVIHNGIDLNVFKPVKSEFRKKHGISVEKFILLGVAFGWEKRKGLDVFIELAKRLDHRFQIVLVGTDDTVDKQLPANIVSVHRTQNQKELAEIYTAADLFINPTREENYPTVNMESIACGTPVVTFNTGGSPEIISPETGIVIYDNSVVKLQEKIEVEYKCRKLSAEKCLEHAQGFDQRIWFDKYVRLMLGNNEWN